MREREQIESKSREGGGEGGGNRSILFESGEASPQLVNQEIKMSEREQERKTAAGEFAALIGERLILAAASGGGESESEAAK